LITLIINVHLFQSLEGFKKIMFAGTTVLRTT
jgi:hypothetical protein